ncbi:MAG TPA: glycine--tRNA ligase [Rhabdochlamydiaceae bacterium]|nr:glycine--tRNA ligase [Rhabdochlamydiaceae bacterium]
MITFQQLIQRLTAFWEKRGCIIHQGHDIETGAGTFNPATFLRCLGPEPYKTAYVEPSRRPKDGRFGENPNRIQLFHQFQVIIKPSPPDIQKLYLQSLEAIGLKLKQHDVRFVHDDWESPTLGAFGLGWEVWVDGMEISQFTYFQSVASLPLKPVSVELTYGLERLAMYVQNVKSMFDVHWNEKYTLGDIIHRNEVEWSAYNFTEASTKMWFTHFEDFEREAKDLIGKHLPIPAYDFVIKASHAFNMLDARGAISTTERARYIGRIRDLARLIAMEYLSVREALGFPLLQKGKKTAKKAPLKKLPKTFDPYRKQDFLLEIGSEQLPATFVPIGLHSLENKMKELLKKSGLEYDAIFVYGTPRRIAISVRGLNEGVPEKEEKRRGPALSSAFDSHGNLTPQGQGFIKSLGMEHVSLEKVRANKVKGLEVQMLKEQEYLFATYKEKGLSIYQIFSEELPKLILNLDFPKKMRWGNLEISYPRPIHWILCLYGEKEVPFELGDVISGRTTYGHAQLSDKKILIKKASDYLPALKKNKVLADVEKRKQFILDQLAKLEKTLKGKALMQERVLQEVLFLTEWPQLTYGTFSTEFLKAPQEVLMLEMVQHQRYFPLANAQGKLKNQFIITADNKPNPLICHGNEKVLSARLTDGVFLYQQDLKTPLEDFNEKLKNMTFQKELGSMFEKVLRLVFHVQTVNEALLIASEKKVARAALLCKADLASELVGEFPELQGTIGKYYALHQKEDPEVAAAIEEHWWPKSEAGQLPKTPCSIVLSLADKIDNLLAYFSVGLKPTSSSDPFSLRRQSIGIIKILLENGRSINLKSLFETCSLRFENMKKDPTFQAEIIEEILRYITSRAKGVFEEKGFKKDEIEASLAGNCVDPYEQFCKLEALHQFRKSSDQFQKLFEVYKRAKGQLEKRVTVAFNPALAQEVAEKELVAALNHLEKQWKGLIADRNYARAFNEIAKLQPPLAHLFDTVLILAEDPKIKDNRIALLQKVFSYFVQLLDFSKIQG